MVTNKKIIFYSANDYEGGATKFFVELVNNFDTTTNKIVVINKKNNTNLYNKIIYPIIKLDIDTFHDKALSRKFAKNKILKNCKKAYSKIKNIILFIQNTNKCEKFLKNFEIDAIYSSSGGYPGDESCMEMLIAAKRLNIRKRILILHSSIVQRNIAQKIFHYFFDKLVSNSATELITVSNGAKLTYESHAYFNKKVINIYNGLNKNQTKNLEQKKANLGLKDELVIGIIGSIIDYKGHIYLIKAFNLIKDKIKEFSVKIVIIGNIIEKSYYKKIIEFIKINNLTSYVIFKHDITPADEYAECFDIMVFPSIAFEGFGLVALEGMIYSKPVIGFNVGGVPEVIKDNYTGYIIENKNYQDLSVKLLKLIRDPELRNILGINAQKVYQENFTLDIMIKNYENLLI